MKRIPFFILLVCLLILASSASFAQTLGKTSIGEVIPGAAGNTMSIPRLGIEFTHL